MDLFNELNIDNKLCCTEQTVLDFVNYGILLTSGNKYYTRDFKEIDVNIIKVKTYNLNINLSQYVQQGIELGANNKVNLIYYMTQKTYDKYKDEGLIVPRNNKDYYRLFDKELWLVSLINT